MCQKVKTLPKKNPADYYQCLLTASLKGFNQPITKVCRNCKLNSTNLATEREQEIQALLTAYQQIGVSLKNLLTPLQND